MAEYSTLLIDVRHRDGSPVSYKIATTLSVESGQLMAWATGTKDVVKFTAAGAAGKFVGVSRESSALVTTLGSNAVLKLAELSVYTTGIHALLGTAGDTYAHGDSVYMGADNTKVTKVDPGAGIVVGKVWLPDGTTKSGAVRVPVKIDDHTITQA